jgi:hypothetical protein
LSGSSSAVERQLPKLDVAGSIPVSRSNIWTFTHRQKTWLRGAFFRISSQQILSTVLPIHASPIKIDPAISPPANHSSASRLSAL